MPSKKKPTKAAAGGKDEVVDPATMKDGSSTTYIGGWSCYETVDAIGTLSEQVTAAHTAADGSVDALPRTSILLLPEAVPPQPNNHNDGSAGAVDQDSAAEPVTMAVADQMNIEGVNRLLCARAELATKTWAAPPSAAPAETTAADGAAAAEGEAQGDEGQDSAAAGQLPTPAAPSAAEPANPFEDALHDVRYRHAVPVGATFAARDVVVRGSCSIEGLPPRIVVPPELPAKPDLDAVTLDDPAGDAAAAVEESASASAKGKKPASAAAKNAKKGKPKLTPEQAEELERKKAAVEAEYLALTEQAVLLAQEQADHLMTFAHPDRWATVVYSHITFTGPVVVRRAHVTFQNCRFAFAGADRPQLLVSQYCRVRCVKCTFEAPQRCGIYAMPSAQTTLSRCLLSGVPQDALWAAEVPGLCPQAGKDGAGEGPNSADEAPAAAGGGGGGGEEPHSADGSTAAGPLPLTIALRDSMAVALHQRAGSVGVQVDSAKVVLQSCSFVALGVGVYVRGSYSSEVLRRSTAAGKPTHQLTQEACDVAMDACAFHHFANTAVLLDKTARLVGLRRSFVEGCAHYGLDCQGGAKAVVVRNNRFTADAVVRIRDGASVSLLHNEFKSIPVNDNVLDNPCLQPVY